MDSPSPKPETPPPQVERRRSQRTYAAIPVEVTWTRQDGVRVSERGETEVFNAHGALLRMNPRVPIPKDIELSRPDKGLSARARLVGFARGQPEGLIRIVVELAVPSEAFWQA